MTKSREIRASAGQLTVGMFFLLDHFFEYSEAMLPLTLRLKHDAQPHQLMLKLFNLQRVNSFYFYPNVHNSLALPYVGFRDHPANYLPIEDYFTFEHGGINGDLGRRTYMSGMAMWNYLLYEAFAQASDEEVMVLNLDAVDDFEKAISSSQRDFLVYNPTDDSKAFDLQMAQLAAGDYVVTFTDSDGGTIEQTLSDTALTAGVSRRWSRTTTSASRFVT